MSIECDAEWLEDGNVGSVKKILHNELRILGDNYIDESLRG